MGVVHLGKICLRWCYQCNVPVLENEKCGICGGQTSPMRITPPGDIRPAFMADIAKISDIVDNQFGTGCSQHLIPSNSLILLNKIPAIDRMDEIIVNGEIVGSLRYDIGVGWKFILRMSGARVLARVAVRGLVVADEGVVKNVVNNHANVMAPGVLSCSNDIEVGDEIIVTTEDHRAFAVGIARMTTDDMRARRKGVAVKVRWAETPKEPSAKKCSADWSTALRANEEVMKRRVDEAVQFIRKLVKKYDLPCVVSFSGGKDSLATLLLTLDAGYRFPIFFIDTGLEFEETIEHIHEISEKLDLPLILKRAPENAFYGHLELFGPPGRDYRWCCKTNKLGPTVKAIKEHFPGGVLAFIGQRRYESESRAEKNRVWKNPWTPGQIGASPIQDWTSLHVWLYLFSKNIPYNIWYERGLDRIGCYLCPASDLSELEIVKKYCSAYQVWEDYLKRYASERGFSDKWVEFGLWRWKRTPKSIIEELDKAGKGYVLDHSSIKDVDTIRKGERGLTLILQKGYSPCVKGFSVEGLFSKTLDFEKVCNSLNMVGEVTIDPRSGYCQVKDIIITKEGALIAKGETPQEIEKNVERVRQAVVKAMECVGCGVCIARCERGALTLEQDHIRIVPDRCSHCGKCIEPCPVLSFGNSAFEF
ncbi:MAG: phosphoadenosine phosphosulfate reductase family protein [Methanomassiliicoccales archaeon]